MNLRRSDVVEGVSEQRRKVRVVLKSSKLGQDNVEVEMASIKSNFTQSHKRRRANREQFVTQHPQALSLRPSPIGLVLRSTEQRFRDNIWVVTSEGYLKLSP